METYGINLFSQSRLAYSKGKFSVSNTTDTKNYPSVTRTKKISEDTEGKKGVYKNATYGSILVIGKNNEVEKFILSDDGKFISL